MSWAVGFTVMGDALLPVSLRTLAAQVSRTVPNVIGTGLQVPFCGINPGPHLAETGRHFAQPAHRFWQALFAAGLTLRQFALAEEHELLKYFFGITKNGLAQLLSKTRNKVETFQNNLAEAKALLVLSGCLSL